MTRPDITTFRHMQARPDQLFLIRTCHLAVALRWKDGGDVVTALNWSTQTSRAADAPFVGIMDHVEPAGRLDRPFLAVYGVTYGDSITKWGSGLEPRWILREVRHCFFLRSQLTFHCGYSLSFDASVPFLFALTVITDHFPFRHVFPISVSLFLLMRQDS